MVQDERLFTLLKLTIFALVIFGLIMVYSSSYIYAMEEFGSSLHFFSKQIVFALAGAVCAGFMARTNFDFWLKHSSKFYLFITGLIVLTLISKGAVSVKGSSRWLNVGGLFRFQPAELLKYATILISVLYFEKYKTMNTKQKTIRGLFLLIPVFMLLFQPDFGMFVLCLFNILFVCFLSDYPRKNFYTTIGIALISFVILIIAAPYRMKRLTSFLDPWSDPQNSGFQVVQSLLAFANGSVLGAGLGNSNEKLFYLPEAHNDFIMSVIGEELGLMGVLLVVFLFLTFIYLGFKIALKAQTKIRIMFSSAVIFSIGLQAMLNMGVVLGMLPAKGLNLPFISYGGSSMLANFLILGLFFCAVKHSNTSSKMV